MTNQEAIEAIKLARSQVEWDYPMDYAAAFDKAIEALEQEPVIRDNGVKNELNRVKDELDPTTKNGLALIHIEGLAEEIRCTMCTNYMKSDRGCDGSCVVNNDMYEAVMDAIEERIQPTTKNDLAVDGCIHKCIDKPTEDCISRADAIKAMQDKAKKLTNEDTINGLCGAVAILFDLPSVTPQEPRWIPVSERLPEDIKPVIVTWKNTDPKSYYQYIVGKHFIGTAHYKSGKWYWYSSVTEDLLAEYGKCDSEEFDEAIEVVAWMPLPKPYEPQESEVEDGKID